MLNFLKENICDPADMYINFTATVELGHFEAFKWYLLNTKLCVSSLPILLDKTIDYNRIDFAKFLFDNYDLSGYMKKNMTRCAAVNGYLELLKFLFFINCPYSEHLSCFVPLHHDEIIKYLVDVKGLDACRSNPNCEIYQDQGGDQIVVARSTQVKQQGSRNIFFMKNTRTIEQLIKSGQVDLATFNQFKSYLCQCIHPHVRKLVSQNTTESEIKAEAAYHIMTVLFIIFMIIYMITAWLSCFY